MVVLKNDYSHCPLKKRPLSVCYEHAGGGDQTEPQDLSLKCGKEAPSIKPQEPSSSFTQNVYPHESETRSVHRDLATESFNNNPHHSVVVTIDKGITNKNLLNSLPNSVPTISTEDAVVPDRNFDDASSPRRYAQVIQSHDSSLHGFKRSQTNTSHLTAGTFTSTSRLTNMHEICSSSKTVCRRKDTDSLSVLKSNVRGAPEGKDIEGERIFPFTSVPSPLDVLGQPTCSRAHSPCVVTVPHSLREIHSQHLPVPSGDPTASSSRRLLAIGQTSSVLVHSENVTPKVDRGLSPKCTSPSLSAPHRPWLSEGPSRASLSKPYLNSERVPLTQAHHPRSLLVSPPGLWAGMVPFPWPMSSILSNPQPPSPPRRHHHQRDCYSPGSESASSDGSSGSSRTEARYSCTDCSKSYSTYSGLSKHKQFHCSALGSKSFACKHCDKVYTSLGALKMHIRTHTLPCKCPLCGKAFSRPWLLQGHIRTHTGEKPFQCSQCDRCFADRSNLRAHLQTHADIKKYACSTCHKTFSRMSLLNKHTEAACPALTRRSSQ